MNATETQNREHSTPETGQADPSMPAAAKPARTRKGKQQSEEPKPKSPTNSPKPEVGKKATDTKSEMVLKKLRGAKGATIEQLMQTTGWQAHSVRGFLSAVVKKKLGLSLASDTSRDGVRRYRIDETKIAG